MIVQTLILSLCLLSDSAGAPGSPVVEVARLDNDMRVKRIAEDAYIVIDTEHYWSNTLVVRLDDGSVVLASSPFEDPETRTLIEWVRRELKPKRMIAINTHFHRDGTGGNSVFQTEGVETWSSRRTAMLQRREMVDAPADSPERKIVLAENFFDLEQGKTFELGGEHVEVVFPGHAHSPDNLVVWFAERKILFGGCIVKPKQLGYLADADVANWGNVVRKMLELEPEIVVPGHGKPGGSELLTRTLAVAEAAN